VACNAFWEALEVELPPVEGKRWYRVVDTSLPTGEDIVPDEEAAFLPDRKYKVRARSTLVLIAR
jgi:glycogen operon protein